MNPVVGLDVSKGESQVQAYLDKGKPSIKGFKVSHTLEGLSLLVNFLEEVRDKTGIQPPVVLEETGHYHNQFSYYFLLLCFG
jgi:transposase